MAYGLIIAIPTVALCGPIFASYASRWATANPPQALIDQVAKESKHDNPPSFGVTLFTILLPVGHHAGPDGRRPDVRRGRQACASGSDFVGDPIVALLIAVLVSLYTLGYARGFKGDQLRDFLTEGLAPGRDDPADHRRGRRVQADPDRLRDRRLDRQGRRVGRDLGAVAGVAGRGADPPGDGQRDGRDHDRGRDHGADRRPRPGVNAPLLALAIGCGSLFLSHVNDAGFWLINQYFGMSVKDTFKTWSLMETLISCVGMAGVMILSVIV